MQHKLRILNRTQPETPRDWFRIENKSEDDNTDVYIYDEIGGWFGTNAADFVDRIKRIDTENITLHLNSPGGEVFDGVAIYNALRDHKASVTVIVDSLAASAASFIAQAGDKIIMNTGSTMMIHDGLAFCVGNEQDMLYTAGILDKISNNISEIYANRAGGTAEDWRALMREEVWYTAKEAVEANLADEVAGTTAPEEAVAAAAKWDLSVFNHAGRADAPSPREIQKRVISNRAKEAHVGHKNSTDDESAAPGTQRVPEQPGTPSDPLPEVNEPPREDEAENPSNNPPKADNKAGTSVGNSTGPALSFLLNKVPSTDVQAVQAHIDNLEAFQQETLQANRKAFVKELADSNKIGASQMSGIEAFALGLTSEQYEAWKATYDDAPALPLLGQHAAGTTNHEGDGGTQSVVDQQIENLKAIVNHHKIGGMAREKIVEMASYKQLVELVPDFKL